MNTREYKSRKSNSVFTVAGEPKRAFLTVTGEASTNSKVQKEVLRIRREGADFASADWTARMLANTF